MVDIPAFQSHHRTYFEGRSEDFDWELFETEIREFGSIVEELPIGTGAGPPTIENGNNFLPGGWAGEFTESVRVLPAAKGSEKAEEIDEETYNSFVEGARRTAGTYGVRTASAYLSLMPQAVREAETIYLAYSQRLIQLTERLFETRLPVTIEKATVTGYELRGSLDFARSIKEQTRGTGRLASREISFSTDTPTARLLDLFHVELGRELTILSKDLGLNDPRLDKQVAYHRQIRQERFPEEVVEVPRTDKVPSEDELEQMKSSQHPPVRELATLWRGYQRDQGTKMDWRSRFDAAVKPVQRVYELWCLERILGVLTDLFGSYDIPSGDKTRLPVPKRYEFNGVRLFYDVSVRDSSTYADQIQRPRKSVGAPDFLIRKDKEPVWMADAKFQVADDVDTSGLYRFLGYVIDYLPETGRAALLCAAGESNTTFNIEGRQTRVFGSSDDVDSAEELIEDEICAATDRTSSV